MTTKAIGRTGLQSQLIKLQQTVIFLLQNALSSTSPSLPFNPNLMTSPTKDIRVGRTDALASQFQHLLTSCCAGANHRHLNIEQRLVCNYALQLQLIPSHKLGGDFFAGAANTAASNLTMRCRARICGEGGLCWVDSPVHARPVLRRQVTSAEPRWR